MWYNPYDTLSHNALINMVLGPRGYGKTYGYKKLALKQFIDTGAQFVYLRRYQTELDLVKDTLFNDIIIKGEFPDHDIQFSRGDVWRVNDEIAGYAMALSRSNYYKSASFPRVKLIIFDEFIIDPSVNMHYLKGEVRHLLDLVETIVRMREDVKVILLANSITFYNPYTTYWNLSLPKNKHWTKAVDGLVLLQLVGDAEFVERKSNTLFGKLTKDTDYGNYSVKNEFLLDSDTFVEKRPSDAFYVCTIENNSNAYGVWWSPSCTTYTVSEVSDPSCKLVYTTTLKDHKPNRFLINSNKGIFGNIKEAFKLGHLRFETQKCKNMIMEIMRYNE